MNTSKIYAGNKLREVRQRLGMSQKDFAARLGISIPYANQMENNHNFIDYDMVSFLHSPLK